MGCREATLLGLYIFILWWHIRCASSIFRTMIMIVLNMMNNHVKYQFVLGSFGHLRPVTCQASSSPSLSHPHAARTLCEYIRIHQHTQYEYYQHSRGSCFKCLTLSSFLAVVVQCGLPFSLPPCFVLLRSASSSCALWSVFTIAAQQQQQLCHMTRAYSKFMLCSFFLFFSSLHFQMKLQVAKVFTLLSPSPFFMPS